MVRVKISSIRKLSRAQSSLVADLLDMQILENLFALCSVRRPSQPQLRQGDAGNKNRPDRAQK